MLAFTLSGPLDANPNVKSIHLLMKVEDIFPSSAILSLKTNSSPVWVFTQRGKIMSLTCISFDKQFVVTFPDLGFSEVQLIFVWNKVGVVVKLWEQLLYRLLLINPDYVFPLDFNGVEQSIGVVDFISLFSIVKRRVRLDSEKKSVNYQRAWIVE